MAEVLESLRRSESAAEPNQTTLGVRQTVHSPLVNWPDVAPNT